MRKAANCRYRISAGAISACCAITISTVACSVSSDVRFFSND